MKKPHPMINDERVKNLIQKLENVKQKIDDLAYWRASWKRNCVVLEQSIDQQKKHLKLIEHALILEYEKIDLIQILQKKA